jgi:MFS family permease
MTSTMQDTSAMESETGGLRGNRNFQLLWIGSAFSLLGLEAADIAYPLVVLAITGSPGWASVFGVVQLVAMLVAGLPAGEWLDRYPPRRMLITAEGARLLTTGGVAVALAENQLSIGLLLVAAVVLGVAQPFSGGARMLVLRAVVPSEQLTAALTRDEVRTASAALAGPPMGAYLFGISRCLPFVATAASFLISTVTALFLRVPPATATEEDAEHENGAPGYFARMFVGVVEVWRNVTLRSTVLLVAMLNAAGAPLVLVTVVVLREQSTAPWSIGLALAALALGGLVGAALVGPLHRLLPPGIILLLLGAVEAAMFGLLALPWGAGWVAGVLFCSMLGVPALRVIVDVLIFRQVPPEIRGRVIAGVMTLFTMGAPLGVGVSGLLLENFTARAALLVLGSVVGLVVLGALPSRTLRTARWPETPDH